MKKYLRVTMPDGKRWDVPVCLIAESRADYYASQEGDKVSEAYKKVFSKEFLEVIDDAFELIDWAANNMNWEDVAKDAILAQQEVQEEIDYQEGWVNGYKEVVEV